VAGPLEDVLRAERAGNVREALAKLKPVQAQVLTLRACGLSYKELAGSLGVQPGSVGQLLARARWRSRRRIGDSRTPAPRMKEATMCISDGMLRAKSDGELSGAELAKVETHLESCERCRERARAIAKRAGRRGRSFQNCGPGSRRTRAGLGAPRPPLAAEPRRGSRWRPRLTPAWGAIALAGLAVLLLGSPPGRAVGQKILGMLRIKAVVAVPMERDFIAEGKGEIAPAVAGR